MGRPAAGTGCAFERCRALGIVRHGRLAAGIVFHRFTGFDLELTVAAQPALWLWPRVVRAVARYVFADLGARRITLRIAEGNRASRRLGAGLGFTLEGTSPFAYDGTDALCTYGMAREACRFLKGPTSNPRPASSRPPESVLRGERADRLEREHGDRQYGDGQRQRDHAVGQRDLPPDRPVPGRADGAQRGHAAALEPDAAAGAAAEHAAAVAPDPAAEHPEPDAEPDAAADPAARLAALHANEGGAGATARPFAGPVGDTASTRGPAASDSGTPTQVGTADGSYNVPQWTREVTLSPGQQRLYDQQTEIGQSTNQAALEQIQRLRGVLNQPLSFDDAPGRIDQLRPGPSYVRPGGQPAIQGSFAAADPRPLRGARARASSAASSGSAGRSAVSPSRTPDRPLRDRRAAAWRRPAKRPDRACRRRRAAAGAGAWQRAVGLCRGGRAAAQPRAGERADGLRPGGRAAARASGCRACRTGFAPVGGPQRGLELGEFRGGVAGAGAVQGGVSLGEHRQGIGQAGSVQGGVNLGGFNQGIGQPGRSRAA